MAREVRKPVGVLTGSFAQLHAAGCIQTLADSYRDVAEAYVHGGKMFIGLFFATGGNPCDGCPKYEFTNGKCEAFQQFHTQPVRIRYLKEQAKREPQEKFRPRCTVCGCKIRGAHHNEGSHHRAAVR